MNLYLFHHYYYYSFFFFALRSLPSKEKLKVLLVLWNLSKNRGPLASFAVFGDLWEEKKKGSRAGAALSSAISRAVMDGATSPCSQESRGGGEGAPCFKYCTRDVPQSPDLSPLHQAAEVAPSLGQQKPHQGAGGARGDKRQRARCKQGR